MIRSPELFFKFSFCAFCAFLWLTSFLCLFVAYFAASLRPAFRLSQFMIALKTRK